MFDFSDALYVAAAFCMWIGFRPGDRHAHGWAALGVLLFLVGSLAWAARWPS